MNFYMKSIPHLIVYNFLCNAFILWYDVSIYYHNRHIYIYMHNRKKINSICGIYSIIISLYHMSPCSAQNRVSIGGTISTLEQHVYLDHWKCIRLDVGKHVEKKDIADLPLYPSICSGINFILYLYCGICTQHRFHKESLRVIYLFPPLCHLGLLTIHFR